MTNPAIDRPRINIRNIRWLASGLYDSLKRYYTGVISFLVTILVFTYFVQIGISFDQSFPDDHLYIVKKWDVTPSRGAKVSILVVNAPMGPPSGLSLVKYIYGVPGDVVTTGGPDSRDVMINGDKVSHAKRFSKMGKPLTVISGGVIPEGMVYVGTPSKDSYDSRYATMALVPYERIKGHVITLF